MKCPFCRKEIKRVDCYGHWKGRLYLKGTCYLKGNKTDVRKFKEVLTNDFFEYHCPECNEDISKFVERG